ncbi:DUF554 domain-containing protein [Radiobacillus kanasensis]|uniref:DUF554 domain-containing protein n=1 Tax=Radiobacillus kanasensis TaxID=2844358 RepID=UPI001E4F61E2|nr:DUF554 domain-containing protein [Radiobacillus kanasensis]UFT99416.1 DUF554 domain-containing protein [Radiobacillus kanasensis]
MALLGTLINGACIILGTVVGLFFTKIPERMKQTIMNGIGLAVLLIGLQMAIKTENIVIVLLSLLTGAILGEILNLDHNLNRFGQWVESKFKPKSEVSVAQGFITASLIFVVGAMAVIGALDSGIRGDHEVLITKGILDGFVALVLTTTLGFGVVLSVVPVILYQGTIALLAKNIQSMLPEAYMDMFIIEMTATGGLLIVAIGLNLLKVTDIKVANLLPSLVTVALFIAIYQAWF